VEQGKNIAVLQGRLSQRMKHSALADIALRISLTAGALITLTGTLLLLTSLPPALAAGVITAGVVSALVAGGGLLFKHGFSGPSYRDYHDATQMQHAVRLLNTLA